MTAEPPYDSVKAWLASRPESVQKLAAEFPGGTVIMFDGVSHHILGYTEDDTLILSPVNPGVDYDSAMSNRVYLCAQHLRDAAKEAS